MNWKKQIIRQNNWKIMLQFNHIDDILATDLWVTFHFMFYSNFHISHFIVIPMFYNLFFCFKKKECKLLCIFKRKFIKLKFTFSFDLQSHILNSSHRKKKIKTVEILYTRFHSVTQSCLTL